MEKVIVNARDGYKLNVTVFAVDAPKGYIQVIHGMEEHQERYEPLASYLNSLGYVVATSNMRGHGDDAPLLGFFKEKKGYLELLEDQKAITRYIKERYKTERVIILAHSMGTIITRNLLMTESKGYEKVILSGYPCPQSAASMGIVLASLVSLFRGPKYYSKLLEDIAIGSFNKSVKNPRTNFDWLSYNEENVDNYIADPYCGHGFKVSALNDLFHLVKHMAKPKLYKDVNKELPILLIRGEEDPCTGFEKGSLKAREILKKAGFTNLKDIKYSKMRHEIFNEKEKEKVFLDIRDFLN